ncbi:hypothetical protein [Candidatus Nitrospira allomarina]|uniref:Transcriptional regulator n=1 Tax=Candidatus Nitrospira allomarina TaxID=3020900 RepID=A0AA96GFA6_9BACT|nr:hypothetical protein [Candidatus Nitrospira allomarina]WNM57589.1 hypothetical protein PP769_16705 [Candidatus Nitrospira allomarina]
MKTFIMVAVAAVTMGVTPVFAENAKLTNMKNLVDQVKADKKLLIAHNMDLTEEESTEFWPLYENYQKDLEPLNRNRAGLIAEYAAAYTAGAVSEDLAKELVNETLKTEEAEVKMRRNYSEKLARVLPPTKMARYLQIENKIQAAIKFDLAAGIPLKE